METVMFLTTIILSVIAILVDCISTNSLKWTSNPYLIPPMTSQSATQYLVFHGPLSVNKTLSQVRCESIGGDLADIDSNEVFTYLHTRLHSPAFIASFLGKTYSGGGLALYPGGAVAIPQGGPSARFPSICEVPLLGTFAIDLRRYSQSADPTLPELEALLKHRAVVGRDPRFAGLSAQEEPVGARVGRNRDVPYKQGTVTQSVTTVTIYGSIETDPALPCCRCCNGI